MRLWNGMLFRAITLAMPTEMIPFFIYPTGKFLDVTPITIGKKPSLETPKKHYGTATIPPKNSPKSSHHMQVMFTMPITVHFIRLHLTKTQTTMTMPKRWTTKPITTTAAHAYLTCSLKKTVCPMPILNASNTTTPYPTRSTTILLTSMHFMTWSPMTIPMSQTCWGIFKTGIVWQVRIPMEQVHLLCYTMP